MLNNISECYCCQELEGCVEAMDSDLVKEELEPNTKLGCITEHPGFSQCCLMKWNLRMAGIRYKTKHKERYKKTGSEEK